MFVTFYGTNETELVFFDDFIFLTIFAERELMLNFEYCFGRSSNLVKTNQVKSARYESRLPTRTAIDRQVELLVRDRSSYVEVCKSVEDIKRKRRERYLLLAGSIDFIDRNIEKIVPVRELAHPGEFEFRREVVSAQKARREDQEQIRKFLVIHRPKINHIYERILNSYICSKRSMEEGLRIWISFVKLHRVAKRIFQALLRKREVFERLQRRDY